LIADSPHRFYYIKIKYTRKDIQKLTQTVVQIGKRLSTYIE